MMPNILTVQVLLHYYQSTTLYVGNAPSLTQAHDWLVANEFLLITPAKEGCYVVTERARVWIEAMRCLPLPHKAWAMP